MRALLTDRAVKRIFLIVLDSVGIGAAPDASEYGDCGANTLGHIAQTIGKLNVPELQQMGLGNVPLLLPGGEVLAGVPPVSKPSASYGAMRERSHGKDTVTGHWEIAGILLEDGFNIFPPGPPSFPPQWVREFEKKTGRSVIGNKAASGTAIIAELGEQHMRDGSWIVYTSADSVIQIAAHEDIVPLAELYAACRIAREMSVPMRVGRVIARPFVGVPGSFRRTDNRRDFPLPLPEPTVLDKLTDAGIKTIAIGKIDDIFNGQGICQSYHCEKNEDAANTCLRVAAEEGGPLLVFANLIDFDMLYGHRRDARGYAAALEQADVFIGQLRRLMREEDDLIVTADHGNDPTFRGTDHTREYVPLLVCSPGSEARSLGIRDGFFDVAQSVASAFCLAPMPRGISFL